MVIVLPFNLDQPLTRSRKGENYGKHKDEFFRKAAAEKKG
jgi:hypothetical protein